MTVLRSTGIFSHFLGTIDLEMLSKVKTNLTEPKSPRSMYLRRKRKCFGKPPTSETPALLDINGLPTIYLVMCSLACFIYFTVKRVPLFFKRIRIRFTKSFKADLSSMLKRNLVNLYVSLIKFKFSIVDSSYATLDNAKCNEPKLMGFIWQSTLLHISSQRTSLLGLHRAPERIELQLIKL